MARRRTTWGARGGGYGGGYGDFPPYVSAAERRLRAAQEAKKRAKDGQTLVPIAIAGRKIATTFWGAAWCTHLESHSDYENRLPRGRTYVRNGSVIDLQIAKGKVTALVQGSELYEVTVTIAPLPAERWTKIVDACAGKIDSLVELLQGKLSSGVMEVVTDRASGLFPLPAQIELKCSCPDWASMCKHVAAALYGVGARLDAKPELLFVLRAVDHLALIEGAGASKPLKPRAGGARAIAQADVSSVFGIDLDLGAPVTRDAPAGPPRAAKKTATKTAAKKTKAAPARKVKR